MNDYWAFSHDRKCLKWEDYELTRHELEEADDLCHGNWIEIQKLYDYIEKLKKILDESNIEYPEIWLSLTGILSGFRRALCSFLAG